MSKEWIVQGYAFPNKTEYEKAKKEQESIAYIRANSDFKDPKKTMIVYKNLVEKDLFETIIGYTFMEQLRRHIISKNIVPEELIPPIKVKKLTPSVRESATVSKKDYKKEYEKLVQKRTTSKYWNIALVAIVVAMFAITYFSPKNNAEVAQTKIQDEYSSWQERLQQQEQELEEREAAIAKKEAELK